MTEKEENVNYTLIIGVIIVELFIIFGISAILNYFQKRAGGGTLTADDYATTSRKMPMIAIAATQSLTALGGGHILGVPGASWDFGVSAAWFVIANGTCLIILLSFVGPWTRRFGYPTINQLFEVLFDKKTAAFLAAMGVGTAFGVFTLETQGVGTVIASMAGWVSTGGLQMACIIGVVVAVLYVIFGGMKEVGWVNVVNAIIMYVGVILAVVLIGSRIPGGWGAVNDFYLNEAVGAGGGPGEWWLSPLANGQVWQIYIVGTVLSTLFYVAIGPQAAQINASAVNVRAVKRALLVAIPINTVFGLCMIAFGMAAKSIPQYAEIGVPPIATFMFLVDTLPMWLLIWVLAAFAAAMLSTMAIQALAMATIVVKDIHIKYFNPNLSDDKQRRYIKIWIIAIAVIGAAFATLLPPVQNAMVWLFSWLVPAFWMFVIGMFWRRSGNAAFWTMIIAAIASSVWTFTQPLGYSNSIVVIIVGIVLGILFTALDKNRKPGLISVYKKDRNSVVAEDLRR